jgi:glutathione S-transferase
MPTTRPRHVITETDEIARALDEAARRWPEDSGNRSRLLARLVREGYQVVIRQRERETRARRDAVARTSGALTGAYGEGYLAALRQDWPE